MSGAKRGAAGGYVGVAGTGGEAVRRGEDAPKDAGERLLLRRQSFVPPAKEAKGQQQQQQPSVERSPSAERLEAVRAAASSDRLCEGELWKQSSSILPQAWTRRFYVLSVSDRSLSYYRRSGDVFPAGFISFEEIEAAEYLSAKKGGRHFDLLTVSRVWHFHAATEEEAIGWVRTINAAIAERPDLYSINKAWGRRLSSFTDPDFLQRQWEAAAGRHADSTVRAAYVRLVRGTPLERAAPAEAAPQASTVGVLREVLDIVLRALFDPNAAILAVLPPFDARYADAERRRRRARERRLSSRTKRLQSLSPRARARSEAAPGAHGPGGERRTRSSSVGRPAAFVKMIARGGHVSAPNTPEPREGEDEAAAAAAAAAPKRRRGRGRTPPRPRGGSRAAAAPPRTRPPTPRRRRSRTPEDGGTPGGTGLRYGIHHRGRLQYGIGGGGGEGVGGGATDGQADGADAEAVPLRRGRKSSSSSPPSRTKRKGKKRVLSRTLPRKRPSSAQGRGARSSSAASSPASRTPSGSRPSSGGLSSSGPSSRNSSRHPSRQSSRSPSSQLRGGAPKKKRASAAGTAPARRSTGGAPAGRRRPASSKTVPARSAARAPTLKKATKRAGTAAPKKKAKKSGTATPAVRSTRVRRPGSAGAASSAKRGLAGSAAAAAAAAAADPRKKKMKKKKTTPVSATGTKKKDKKKVAVAKKTSREAATPEDAPLAAAETEPAGPPDGPPHLAVGPRSTSPPGADTDEAGRLARTASDGNVPALQDSPASSTGVPRSGSAPQSLEAGFSAARLETIIRQMGARQRSELVVCHWLLMGNGVAEVASAARTGNLLEVSLAVRVMFAAATMRARIRRPERGVTPDWPGEAPPMASATLFADSMRQHVGGANTSVLVVNALLALLATPLHELNDAARMQTKRHDGFRREVANPAVWMALLSSLEHSEFHTRCDALKDVNAVLLSRDGAASLTLVPGWRTLLLSLLADVPSSMETRVVQKIHNYTLNVFTQVHYHLFVDRPRDEAGAFLPSLLRSLNVLHLGFVQTDDAVTRAMLGTLAVKLTAQRRLFPPSPAAGSMWERLLDLLKAVRLYVFGPRSAAHLARTFLPQAQGLGRGGGGGGGGGLTRSTSGEASPSRGASASAALASGARAKGGQMFVLTPASERVLAALDRRRQLLPSEARMAEHWALHGPHWTWSALGESLQRDLDLVDRVLGLTDSLGLGGRSRASRSASDLEQFLTKEESAMMDALREQVAFFHDSVAFLAVLQARFTLLEPPVVLSVLHRFLTARPGERKKAYRSLDDYLRAQAAAEEAAEQQQHGDGDRGSGPTRTVSAASTTVVSSVLSSAFSRTTTGGSEPGGTAPGAAASSESAMAMPTSSSRDGFAQFHRVGSLLEQVQRQMHADSRLGGDAAAVASPVGLLDREISSDPDGDLYRLSLRSANPGRSRRRARSPARLFGCGTCGVRDDASEAGSTVTAGEHNH